MSKQKQAYFVVFGLSLLVVITLVSSHFDILIPHLDQAVRHFVDGFGAWAPVLYIVMYAVIALTGLSASVLSLIALGIFPPTTAFIVILAGSSISAYLAFILARWSRITLPLPPTNGTGQRRLINALHNQIEQNAVEHGFRTVFLLRMARLPYIALRYAAGFVPVLSLRAFMAATVLSNAMSAVVYVVFGIVILPYMAVATLALLIGWGLFRLVMNIRRAG